MAFVISGVARSEGTPLNGLQCVAYNETRFSSVPVYGSPFPDASAADAGPVISGETYGGFAAYQLAVPTSGTYYVGCYATGDPNQIITWQKKMPTPHTSLQGWTAISATQGVKTTTTTIAAGSNGVNLPTGTINVVSNSGFDSTGQLLINVGPSPIWTLVAYTGLGTNTFTGCTGGAGQLATGQIACIGYRNGSNRRLVMASQPFKAQATGDEALLDIISTVAGQAPQLVAQMGIVFAQNNYEGVFSASFPVDPLGIYGMYQVIGATGLVGPTGALVTTVDS
jgi:hypothetical protein